MTPMDPDEREMLQEIKDEMHLKGEVQLKKIHVYVAIAVFVMSLLGSYTIVIRWAATLESSVEMVAKSQMETSKNLGSLEWKVNKHIEKHNNNDLLLQELGLNLQTLMNKFNVRYVTMPRITPEESRRGTRE